MKTYAHIDENGFVFATVTSSSPVPKMAGKGLEIHEGEAHEFTGKIFDKKGKRYFEPLKKIELQEGKEVELIDLIAGKPVADLSKEFTQKKGAE